MVAFHTAVYEGRDSQLLCEQNHANLKRKGFVLLKSPARTFFSNLHARMSSSVTTVIDSTAVV